MISRKHKCIYIHIPKCAGSSIEKGFGVRPKDFTQPDYEHLMGWCPQNKIFMHHATPQQLLDLGLICEEEWDSYYKFIVFRNSYDRAFSDYKYLLKITKTGTFEDYIQRKNEFHEILTDSTKVSYRGDHLTPQKNYFFLNNQPVKYNLIINFDFIQKGLEDVIKDLKLPSHFFHEKVNVSKHRKIHYSLFYDRKKQRLVDELFKVDIEYFKFQFEDKRSLLEKFMFSINFLT